MMVFVTGGSGSGKSAFAEGLIANSSHETRCYIATMEVWDAEGRERVNRHRAMRQGKGFTTFEYPTVTALNEQMQGAVLVEDLTNLLMNQWFGVDKSTAVAQVTQWLQVLENRCELLVIVGNDLTSDGTDYDQDMTAFLQALGCLTCELAQKSDAVYQVVAGVAKPLVPRQGVGGMTLIIGGKYQGKTAYASALARVQNAPVIDDLAQWLQTQPSVETALSALRLAPNTIIVCDEVGCGVVPLDKEQRAWRERVGRVSAALAEQADVVIHMVCGIPTVIKE